MFSHPANRWLIKLFDLFLEMFQPQDMANSPRLSIHGFSSPSLSILALHYETGLKEFS